MDINSTFTASNWHRFRITIYETAETIHHFSIARCLPGLLLGWRQWAPFLFWGRRCCNLHLALPETSVQRRQRRLGEKIMSQNYGCPTVSPDPWNSTSGGFLLKNFSTKTKSIQSSFDDSVHLHLGCWFPFLNRSICPWSVMWFINTKKSRQANLLLRKASVSGTCLDEKEGLWMLHGD